MFGLVQIKVLVFGLLLATPAVALWGLRSHKSLTMNQKNPTVPAVQSVADSVTRIPVEVITNGSAPQWVYVQVGNQAVPEPGMVSLLAVATLFLTFRRQRA